MRLLFLAALLASYTAFAADYKLNPGASVREGTLNVAPRVQGPPGAALRYEIRTTREGRSGKSSSSQSGGVRLGQYGSGALATSSISVTPQDRYRITLKVLEGGRVVAEKTVKYQN